MSFTIIKKIFERFRQIEVKIGIKTALAASISFLLGIGFNQLYHRPDILASGLWSALTSVVVIQARLEVTNKAALDRFLGVFVGCVAGTFFMYHMGSGVVSLAISVFGTIVLCSLLDIKDSFRVASMSTAMIIIMGGLRGDLDPWVFGFFRFIESAIGILVAVIIAFSVWPQSAAEKLKANIIKELSQLSQYYRGSALLEPNQPAFEKSEEALYRDIKKIVKENRKFSDEVSEDIFVQEGAKQNLVLIANEMEEIYDSVTSIRIIDKGNIAKILDDTLAGQVNQIIDKTNAAFQTLAKKLGGETVEDSDELNLAMESLRQDLLRFRDTRKTRQFTLADVENFYVYFNRLETIAKTLQKLTQPTKS